MDGVEIGVGVRVRVLWLGLGMVLGLMLGLESMGRVWVTLGMMVTIEAAVRIRVRDDLGMWLYLGLIEGL